MKRTALVLLYLFLLVNPFCFSQHNSLQHTVYFDVDSYEISDSELERLKDFINRFDSIRVGGYDVVGHTDSDASNAYNLKLSLNRSTAVATFMSDNGIDERTIRTTSYGEERPVNKNASAAEKKLNRRVEIWTTWIPDYVEEEGGDIKDLYAKTEQKKQVNCIHPSGNEVLRLDQGTIIYFPEQAFGDLDGDCIEIKAKEFYQMSDMILENLSTTSNGQLLETEGMIYIEATYNGEPIELAPGKEITVFMPTDSIRNDVAIFDGERDAHTDIMNWTLDNAGSIDDLNSSDAFFCNTDRAQWDFTPDCFRCRFFCRIKRIRKASKGIVSRPARQNNRSFRRCQRRLRRGLGDGNGGGGGNPLEDSLACAKLDSLMQAYGVNNRIELLEAMNQEAMEKYGVENMQQLRDTLNAIKMAEIAGKIERGEADQGDIDYYVFNRSRLGWINVDAFSKLDGKKITMTTNLPVNKNTDCKAVFKNVRGILPSSGYNRYYSFENVPRGNMIWLIAIKYTGKGKIYLSIESTKTRSNVDNIHFKEVTLEELRKKLKVLD